jgi:NAD-dependent SIR2 family protein deacetylase
MSSLFIKFACILATLNVRPAIQTNNMSKVDQHKKIMEFLDPNSIYVPKDVQIAIYPRSSEIVDVVKSAFQAQ